MYGEQVPSKPIFSRVLSLIDDEEVVKIIIEIMQDMVNENEKVVAVEGKAIRKTYKENYTKSSLQILTAYCTETGLFLGQEMISSEDKTNEIPVMQEMIKNINIKGKIFTGDALHT